MHKSGWRGSAGRRVGVLVSALAVVVVAVAAAALVGRGSAGGGSAAAGTPAPPLQVLATSPAAGATDVAPNATLSVTMSAPLAPGTATPTLTPAVPGSWSRSGSTLIFTPEQSLPPYQHEQLVVPAGHTGVRGEDGASLPAAVTVSFTVAPLSTERAQQLLAQLGYLPLTFTPSGPGPAPVDEAIAQAGSFSWKWATFPAALTSQWVEGQPNVITRGAVMAFESENGLAVDGIVGPEVSAALLADVASGKTDPNPDYDWVDVSMALPETVTVWRDGQAVYQTPANTGVPAAATTIGTFPVYLRYRTTTMSGTNPNGTHYHDTGIPWVSYFNGGQALHGFVRAAYGFPQSDGCVEMPPANAAVVWPMTPLGTLVTVQA